MSAVYKAIAAVQGELAKTGISKDRTNTQGSGYKFRGIDDVYAALSPLLAKHGLCVIPRMIDREQVERASQRGGALFYTTVKAEFDFVAVEDGSKHTAATYGEAMDSGDKSTNKAMSAAYKYAAFMTFAIPTEGDNDADAQTHEVAPRQEPQRSAKREMPFPQGPMPNITSLKAQSRELWREIAACGDHDQLDILLDANRPLLAQMKDALPDWWTGGKRDNGDAFEGLEQVIQAQRASFASDFRQPIFAAG